MVRRFFLFCGAESCEEWLARNVSIMQDMRKFKQRRVKIRFFGKLDAFFREKVRNAYIIVKGKNHKINLHRCGYFFHKM